MITIRPFSPSDSPAFRDLNLAWIKEHFEIEPEDQAQLDDPQSYILDKGGLILIADFDGETVGTVALVPGHVPNTIELIKMSAREDLRGRGIGKALMTAAIESAREKNAARIWLETSTKLDAAIALYKKFGFRDLRPEEWGDTPFSRCNSQMVLEL